jgi:membrane protein
MQADPTPVRWLRRVDRDRLRTFFRFLAHRFVDDRCFESAGALAYTTVFALVPLTAVVLSLLAAFPVFDRWTQQLIAFAFSIFVPESAATVAGYLAGLAQSARQLSVGGVIALVVSVLLTMRAIEQTFDRIWRVPRPRPTLWRLTAYWTLLTLGILLGAASLAVTSYLYALPAMAGQAAQGAGDLLLRWVPTGVALAVFTLAYRLIPNRPVPLRFALAGGVLATGLFEAAKHGFAAYLRGTTFEELYGAIAIIPIFLLWVWLSWVVILLGASIAASLSAFRYQPRAERLPQGAELYACLRLLARLDAARAHGEGLDPDRLRELEPALTVDLARELFAGLSRLAIVQRSENGAWHLSRDPARVSLADLHEGMHLRLPPAGAPLPGADDAIGRIAVTALNHLREPLDALLRHPLADFLPRHSPSA